MELKLLKKVEGESKMSITKIKHFWVDIKPFLFSTIGTLTIINACVAGLAFIKDVLLAGFFGTSLQADGLALAFFLPDTIGNNLFAAAIGVSCVPVFSKVFALNEKDCLALHVRTSLVVFTFFAFLIMLILYIFSEAISGWLAGSSTSELGHLTLSLLRILIPIVLLYPALVIGNSILQTYGKFTIPAAAPLISHGIIIISILIVVILGISKEDAVYLVSIAIGVGVIAMVVMVWAVPTEGKKLIKRKPFFSSFMEHRNIWSIFLPYLIILATSQAVYFVERKIASTMEVGTLAGLNYAFRLSQFPIWVFVAAVYSVVLPSISQDIALNDKNKLKATLSIAFKNILMVTLPTTLILFFLRVPIITVLFQRGAFNSESVFITSDLLEGYSLSIIGLAFSAVCLRYCLASGVIRLPIIVTFISTGLNIGADYHLKHLYGAQGIGYGAAIGATVNALFFLMIISISFRFSIYKAFRFLIKIVIANIVPCLLLIICAREWSNISHYGNWMTKLFVLAFIIAISSVIYYLTLKKLKVFKSSEMKVG